VKVRHARNHILIYINLLVEKDHYRPSDPLAVPVAPLPCYGSFSIYVVQYKHTKRYGN